MLIDVTLSNYRCFPAAQPATFTIGPGVTAFVGENNAGKSAILRALHDFRRLLPVGPRALNNALADPPGGVLGSVRDEEELFTSGSREPVTISFRPRESEEREAVSAPVRGVEIRLQRGPGGVERKVRLLTSTETRFKAKWRVDDDAEVYREDKKGTSYGSAVQTVMALTSLANALYIPSMRHVHPGPGELFDLKCGDTFAGMWDNLQNGHSVQGREKAELVEAAIADLFGVNSVRISKTSGQPGVQFRLGRDSQRRSDELGNGLAQAVVSIFTAALKPASFILIDEPEIGLHPKLQMRFIAALQRFAPAGVVFSTHNIGLAMNVAERVYSVARHEPSVGQSWSEVTRFEETPDLAAFLGAMSHASYGDAGSRTVLLVEGPSDVRMVQVLLKQWNLLDAVIVIHAGGSSTFGHPETARAQLAGLSRVCPRIWCLADSECDKKGVPDSKRIELKLVCDKFSIPCLITKRRALENYATDLACRAAFHGGARALEPTDKHDGAAVKWDKSDAWRALEKMSVEDWANTDVGEFFQQLSKAVQRH